MPLLSDVARYVRSKNAGPFWLTIDIFCDGQDAYRRLRASAALTQDGIAKLFGVPASGVQLFPDDTLNVIKISFPRPVVAGSFRDRDAHAGQYFVPLLSVSVD
jgi:hypothetical protein